MECFVLGSSSAKGQKPFQRKKERPVSKKVYSYLAQSYTVHLCCDSCIDDQPDVVGDRAANDVCYVRVRLGHKGCGENRLALQEKRSSLKDDFSWLCIRPCPLGFKSSSGICDNIHNGLSCHQGNHCLFPHSQIEKELWTKYFANTKNGSSITMEGFISDLRCSTLRVHYEVEQMCQELEKLPAAELRLICRECWQEGKHAVAEKRRRVPECQNGHHWSDKSKKLVVDMGNDVVIDLDDKDLSDEGRTVVETIQKCRQHLSGLKVTPDELIKEVKRVKVKRQEETVSAAELKDASDEHLEGFFNDDNSTAGSYSSYPEISVDDESQIDVEEDLEEIYDDGDLEDTMTVCSSDLVSSDDEAFAEELFYPLKSVAEARSLLVLEPDKYKRCTIHLDGPFSAKCRMLDEGFRVPRVPKEEEGEVSSSSENDDVIRELEIRGRANCGPCFDGDEVVVELKATKELDGDKIIYRGTVIAVLTKKIQRKAYLFVCRVDTYHSHLMKPLDGVAPKIHVVNSVLKKKYFARKDELVALYSKVEDGLKLRKIIKLDPRQRRDMLFVVKYVHPLV